MTSAPSSARLIEPLEYVATDRSGLPGQQGRRDACAARPVVGSASATR